MTSAVDLDDAVQEVFVECFRDEGVLERWDSDRPGGFRAFLFGVVRNVALRFERKRATKARVLDVEVEALDAVPADDPSLSQVFDRAFARKIVAEAAQRQAQRAVTGGEDAVRRVELLRLRIAEDQPIREIATAWSEDAAHLHHQYALARDEFRRALASVLEEYFPGQPELAVREGRFLLSLLGGH